jgi:hypothetical protein
LSDNEELRRLVASLEAERTSLEEKLRLHDDVAREVQALKELAGSFEREKLRLQEQLVAQQEEIGLHREEHVRLRCRLADIEGESRRFSEQYVEVERQNSNLANVYVASYQLHGTLERDEVLRVIHEILANLVGCEETAVLELSDDGAALQLASSNGIDPERCRTVPLGTGAIGRAALSGELYVAGGHDSSAADPDLTACIPLKLDGRVSGAIAVFKLLPQKPALEAIDHELFDLLATHAAVALYCTTLHARRKSAAQPGPGGSAVE